MLSVWFSAQAWWFWRAVTAVRCASVWVTCQQRAHGLLRAVARGVLRSSTSGQQLVKKAPVQASVSPKIPACSFPALFTPCHQTANFLPPSDSRHSVLEGVLLRLEGDA